MNSISKTPQIRQNVSFEGLGKIKTLEYIKLGEKEISSICFHTLGEDKALIPSISETINKEESELKKVYGEALTKINEFYDAMKESVIQEEKPATVLKGIFKKMFADLGLVDKDGNMTKFKKKIVIERGDDIIPDEIEADEIIDNGSRKIQRLIGKDIVVSDVQNNDLEIIAKDTLDIYNSTFKSAISKNSSDISDSKAKEKIKSYNLILENIKGAPKIESTYVKIFGDKNEAGEIFVKDGFLSHNNLTAERIKSETGNIIVEGKLNNIKYIEGKNDISLQNTEAIDVISEEGNVTTSGEKNIIKNKLKGNLLNLENTTVGNIFCHQIKTEGYFKHLGTLKYMPLFKFQPYENLTNKVEKRDLMMGHMN